MPIFKIINMDMSTFSHVIDLKWYSSFHPSIFYVVKWQVRTLDCQRILHKSKILWAKFSTEEPFLFSGQGNLIRMYKGYNAWEENSRCLQSAEIGIDYLIFRKNVLWRTPLCRRHETCEICARGTLRAWWARGQQVGIELEAVVGSGACCIPLQAPLTHHQWGGGGGGGPPIKSTLPTRPSPAPGANQISGIETHPTKLEQFWSRMRAMVLSPSLTIDPSVSR